MIKLTDYPTPFAGVSLGVIGISAFWGAIDIGAIIAACLLLPIIIKFISHPKLLVQDLKHPTVGSVIPTMAMSMMLMSQAIRLFLPITAITLWLIAVILHIIFFSVFTYHRLRDWKIDHVVPSWFVPPIGIVVACLTVPTQSLTPLAHILLYFGIISYTIMLPLVIYRLSLGSKIEDARKPTLAILAAPASLTLAGYFAIVASPNMLLVLILFSIAIVMTISVYIMLFHMLRLSFSPAFAAFTFPLAISATAMMKMSQWTITQVSLYHYAKYFHAIALIEGVLATLVISYVLSLTIKHIINKHLLVET